MKAAKLFSAAAAALLLLSLAACNTNGTPPAATYTIGGTVTNLAGSSGLVLQDNQNDMLPVNANGSFTFAITVPSGSAYSVGISAQPSHPTQTCGVSGASGMATANVTNIQVNCAHNEWTWAKGPNTVSGVGVYGTLGVAAMNNNPGARQIPATWTDSSGNFWLFGGNVFDAGNYNLMNDLWKFSAGEWTWMGGSRVGAQQGSYGVPGVPSMSNVPGARYDAVRWTDPSGDFWLFGGTGYDSTGVQGSLNDLWKYSAGEWTWIAGSNLQGQPGTYGSLGLSATSNIPSARFGSVSWTDSSGSLWVFGGIHYDSHGSNGGMLNDLWKYSNGEWTWESGSNLTNQKGVYGTQGMAAQANAPGARDWAVGWTDSSGDFWLFGGAGWGSTGATSGLLNDLWKYSNGQWTWMAGPLSIDQPGTFGTQGLSTAGSNPGSRQHAVSWADSSGNLWLFGGNGIDSASGTGLLNDMWKYADGEWTWMSGSNLINQSGVYGVQSMPAPGNIPGTRVSASGWVDANGNLWLFGGYGFPATGTEGNLSDLWMYMP